MAWRNIWRNRRRTIVTTAAMTLTLLVTILYSGMVEGMLVNLEADALDFEVGAVQVFARGYQDNPSLYRRIDDADDVVRKLGEAGMYFVAPDWRLPASFRPVFRCAVLTSSGTAGCSS